MLRRPPQIAAALAAVLVAALLPVLAAPASAQSGCAPAGGGSIPEPSIPSGDFAFVGGGWGHGAGMSQYGAQGAARLGCSVGEILSTYYPGTALEAQPSPSRIVIGLASNAASVDVTAQGGAVPWELCHYQTGQCEPLPVTQDAGATWTVVVDSDATYTIRRGQETVWEGGDLERNLRALLSSDDSQDRRAQVSATGNTYRWGVLQFDSVQSSPSYMFLTVEIPGMERYLRGIAEVPASWPAAALQAQVVAARSYALRRIRNLGDDVRDDCRCHLRATPADQNYTGWTHEAAAGSSWRSAVDATAGQVLTYGGQIAEAFYSSSHGGQSESSAFVFGGALDYIRPVDDSRWDLASDNPFRRWAVAFTPEEVGAAAKVGTATDVELLEPRGAGGRVGTPDRGYGGVRVTGTEGSVVLSGDTLRQRLGLRSTLFDLRREPGGGPSQPPPPPAPPPNPAPPPPPSGEVERIAADNRITTAVAVSRQEWDLSDDVVIASAENFPDALAGVALASQLGAPLLLSGRDRLPAEVVAEIERLGADEAWLLGGTAALSTQVRGGLADRGIVTHRLAGGTRYATAGEIARTAVATGSDTAALALGEDWPDAVSAGSLAALPDGPPILLTQRDAIPDETVSALRDLGVQEVHLIGGSAVIGPAVEQQLADLGLRSTRLAGPSRFATSATVAEVALTSRSGEVPVVLASAGNFPDALPAGALAARVGGLLLLVPADDLSHAPDVMAFLQDHAAELGGGLVVGGPNAVADRVLSQVGAALGG